MTTSVQTIPPGVLALGGAVLGTVVGLTVVDVPVTFLPLLVIGVLAIVAGTSVSLLLVGHGSAHPATDPGDAPGSRRMTALSPVPPAPVARSAAALPPRVPPPPRHIVHVLPPAGGDAVDANPGAGGWWNRQLDLPGAPAGTQEPDAPIRPAPELDSYTQDALVVQCPNCAEFRVDVERSGDAYEFGCPSCGWRWTWRPGDAWPGINVSPRRRSRGSAEI
jgi:hypothetical protein